MLYQCIYFLQPMHLLLSSCDTVEIMKICSNYKLDELYDINMNNM